MNVDYKSVVELVLNCKSLILNNDKAHQITVKGLADYVTQVDFSVQSYLTGALAERYPDIQFLGEEGQKAHAGLVSPGLDPRPGGWHHQFNS